MKRFITCLIALVGAPAMAQTTLDITVLPSNNTCSYITGPVTNGATSGHLQATASSSSGNGCGTGTGSGDVTFGPASPLSPQTTSLSGPSGSVNYTFQALNATQCTAAIAGNASGSFTGGSTLCTGTGASTCSNRLVSATASFTNTLSTDVTDTVTLTCQGSGAPSQSVATVLVPHQIVAGNCPSVPGDISSGVASFTQQTGIVSVRSGGDEHLANVDITQWNSLFGAFPGNINTVYYNLPVTNYISLQFQGSNFFSTLPVDWAQPFEMGSSNMQAKVSMTISTTCGDFRPTTGDSTVVKNCMKIGVKTQGLIKGFGNGGDPSSQCVLQDGKPYYFNIINADISQLTSTGGKAITYKDGPGSTCLPLTCEVPIQDNKAGKLP
jgi:hypothetical protein